MALIFGDMSSRFRSQQAEASGSSIARTMSWNPSSTRSNTANAAASGRKILTQDFERLAPAAALAINLTHADYVEIVCGSLDRLADAFAQLDAANRSRSIAAATKHRNTTVETASLSTLDRRLVRKSAMGDRIIAAAQSM